MWYKEITSLSPYVSLHNIRTYPKDFLNNTHMVNAGARVYNGGLGQSPEQQPRGQLTPR